MYPYVRRVLSMLGLVLIFLTLSACGLWTQESPGVLTLEEALQTFQDSDNYTLELTVDFFNIIDITMKTTESLSYVFAVDSESIMIGYIDRTGVIPTAYTRVDEHEPWTRSIFFNPIEEVLQTIFFTFNMVGFEAEWFVQEDALVYRIAEEYKVGFFRDSSLMLDDFTLTLGPGSVLFDIQATIANEAVSLIMFYTDLGTTQISLPVFDHVIEADDFNMNIGYEIDIPEDLEPIGEGYLVGETIVTHTIVIEEAGEYAIWSLSTLATVGSLYLNDRLIAEDDIMGPMFNFMLKLDLDPGTYRLDVRNFVFEEAGPYELYLLRLNP